MEIGQTITIGRMGQQPMHIADTTVDPEHARLRRTGTGTYQIEDLDSAKGVFVFGMRVVRKTIKGDTPIFLGQYKTSVRQLLTDRSSVDLQQVWAHYEHEKIKWDRYSMLVNSIRMLTPIITMLLTHRGPELDGVCRSISGGHGGGHRGWRESAGEEDAGHGRAQHTYADRLRVPPLPPFLRAGALRRATQSPLLPQLWRAHPVIHLNYI